MCVRVCICAIACVDWEEATPAIAMKSCSSPPPLKRPSSVKASMHSAVVVPSIALLPARLSNLAVNPCTYN